jgi:hypothetical protein
MGPFVTLHSVLASSARQDIACPVADAGEEPQLIRLARACAEPGGGSRHSLIRLGWSRSVNVEYGLAADAAVQQGVDRGPGLAP